MNGSAGTPFFCAGILGKPAIHSRSPQLFRHYFQSRHIPGEYLRFAVDSVEELQSIERFLPLRFLNITSPFKYEVDVFAGKSKKAGNHAKNVLWKGSVGWETENTDQEGIRGPLSPWLHEREHSILIVGSGGAAEAAIQALAGQEFSICARKDQRVNELKRQYPELKGHPWPHLPEAIDKADIIVYSIPGHIAADLGVRFRAGQVVLDANYQDSLEKSGLIDPTVTYLDGYDWLVHQAIPVMKRFDPGFEPDFKLLRESVQRDHLLNLDRLALIGLPGSGKTSVGHKLSERLGLPFVDLDREIESMVGMDIPAIFREKGEAWFREKETLVLSKVLRTEKGLIACGGGIVGRKENRKLLKERAFPIWLMVDAGTASGRLENEERPLFNDKDLKEIMLRLYDERLQAYAGIAELCIDVSNRSIYQVVERLYEAYYSVK